MRNKLAGIHSYSYFKKNRKILFKHQDPVILINCVINFVNFIVHEKDRLFVIYYFVVSRRSVKFLREINSHEYNIVMHILNLIEKFREISTFNNSY